MAGYAAVISLKKTIEHLLESSHISLVAQSHEIIQLACTELETFQEILERLDKSRPCKSRKKLNALDGRISLAVWKFEDLLESHLVDHILPKSERAVSFFSIDLQTLQQVVNVFVETLKDMQKEYIFELENMPLVEEDELGSSRADFQEEVVGLSEIFERLRDRLTTKYLRNGVFQLNGMAGIGKTLLAKKIFQDPMILRGFEHRAWIAVGRRSSQFIEIAKGILAQVDPNNNQIPQGEEKIGEHLKKVLEGKRCLIVLDDVWEEHALSRLAWFLPLDDGTKVSILFTSRLEISCPPYFNIFSYPISMRLLHEEESKELLCWKVFGAKDFPRNLEEAALKIVENCEGLPLMIVTVADLLSKAKNNDPQFWNEVARKRSSVLMDAYEQVSKVLYPTYDCLPQHFKMFFLYVGGFSPEYEIPVSKLINLLTAERFIQLEHLEDMHHHSHGLIWFGRENKILKYKPSTMEHHRSKLCQAYSWWWHLFNTEASKEKFHHVLNRDIDGLLGGAIKDQRRLCLHSNFVFNFEIVHHSVKSHCASTAHSLICSGPYHPYPMPLDVGFKLLRVLDAHGVRFYNFPTEILDLVLLQYLALTCNTKLPSSISKLFNLQFLIIHPHMNIKSCRDSSYVPIQIWDMQELKHIEIFGSNLPNPNSAATLQKLSTLVGVGVDTCTGEVVKKLPNVKKLGFQIELTPYDDGDRFSCLGQISELENLEKLKFRIMNPEVKPEIPFVAFPSSLRKLVLSGTGYPWEYMDVIGSLPNLMALKLQSYAFRGEKWEVGNGSFSELEYLVIEDSDVVKLKIGSRGFPMLETLIIKHCYKLKELDWPSDCNYGSFSFVDCNPSSVVTFVNQLKPRRSLQRFHVDAYFEGQKLIGQAIDHGDDSESEL